MSSHESLQSHRAVNTGSNRNFGLTFAAIFLIFALWPWLRHGNEVRLWALFASMVFILLAIFADHFLSPLNKFWFKLGLSMHAVVSPVIMLLLFYGAVTPTALVLRLLGKDLLNLKIQNTKTYWIKRRPLGPDSGSMRNQY